MKKSDSVPATTAERVGRQRKLLADTGGARIDAHIDADGLARLNAAVETRVCPSVRAAVSHAVSLLPPPKGDTPGLRPCPFCRNAVAPLVRKSGHDSEKWHVLCDEKAGGCGARSGDLLSKVEAAASWNGIPATR